MNDIQIYFRDKFFLSKLIFGAAAVVLAIDPVLWLVQTWRDPSYDSSGFIVAGQAAIYRTGSPPT